MNRQRTRAARRMHQAAMAVATLAACWLAAGAPMYRYY